MRRARSWVFIGIAAFAIVASACSSKSDSSSASSSGDAVTGSLNISGSSTVLPITNLVTENFSSTNPGVSASVDGPGTGDGFVLFCEGKTDISDASRQIEDDRGRRVQEGGHQLRRVGDRP